MAYAIGTYKTGDRVRVTQQVPRLSGTMVTSVEGLVMASEQQKTGSWFAHSEDKKLWMDRLQLRKDDGELVWCNLDRYSRIEVVEAAKAAEPADDSAG